MKLPTLLAAYLITSAVSFAAAAEGNSSSRTLLSHDFEAVPAAPWLLPHGWWKAQDGGIVGTENPAEHHGGSIKGFAEFTDADFFYDVRFQEGTRHTLGINSSPPGHLFHIDFTTTMMRAVKNDLDKDGPDKPQILGQAELKLKNDVWYPLTVRIRGDVMTAEIDGVALRAEHLCIARPKGSFNLYVAGGSVGFRRFRLIDEHDGETKPPSKAGE